MTGKASNGVKNFWVALPRPFFALAPLEDVTDAAFRRLIARHGKPHVMFTEFTSADGFLLADEDGQKKIRKKLLYSESERPVVAQIFSAVPAYIEEASQLVASLGFDGVDINMGCPVSEVVRQNCGAALIKNPSLARELTRAAKKSGLPVSVKTRIGYDGDELEAWLPELLAEEPSAVILHARTRKEMSGVPAHWDAIARAVSIRDVCQNGQSKTLTRTLIVGNGDVRDIADAREKVNETKCDGVMLGRAIYGNPWLFGERKEAPTPREKINALLEHLALFDELLGGVVHYALMKKHFKAYISGWSGAKELRIKLMETVSVQEALAVLEGALRV